MIEYVNILFRNALPALLFILLSTGFACAQQDYFLGTDLNTVSKQSDFSLIFERVRNQKVGIALGFTYGNDKKLIFLDQDPNGFLRRNVYYDSYLLGLDFRIKLLARNFIYKGKSFELGIGGLVHYRTHSDSAYEVDFREQFPFYEKYGIPRRRGLESIGGLAFIGYRIRLAGPIWFGADFSVTMQYVDAENDAFVESVGFFRYKIKYLFGWRKHRSVIKISKAPLVYWAI